MESESQRNESLSVSELGEGRGLSAGLSSVLQRGGVPHGPMGAPVLSTWAYLRALSVLYPCPSVLQTAEAGPVQGQPRDKGAGSRLGGHAFPFSPSPSLLPSM